jgi:hypothetical protein
MDKHNTKTAATVNTTAQTNAPEAKRAMKPVPTGPETKAQTASPSEIAVSLDDRQA